MAHAADRQDADGISRADLDFHEVLVRLSESSRLIRMHQTLLTETRMCVLALKGTYPDSDVRVPEHKGIADAIGEGDAAKVDRLIIAHMDDALGRLVPKFPSAAKQQLSQR
jgi:DNA-binding GntR family transcriptional regulator